MEVAEKNPSTIELTDMKTLRENLEIFIGKHELHKSVRNPLDIYYTLLGYFSFYSNGPNDPIENILVQGNGDYLFAILVRSNPSRKQLLGEALAIKFGADTAPVLSVNRILILNRLSKVKTGFKAAQYDKMMKSITCWEISKPPTKVSHSVSTEIVGRFDSDETTPFQVVQMKERMTISDVYYKEKVDVLTMFAYDDVVRLKNLKSPDMTDGTEAREAFYGLLGSIGEKFGRCAKKMPTDFKVTKSSMCSFYLGALGFNFESEYGLKINTIFDENGEGLDDLTLTLGDSEGASLVRGMPARARVPNLLEGLVSDDVPEVSSRFFNLYMKG